MTTALLLGSVIPGSLTMGQSDVEVIERIGKKVYNKELFRLQLELIKLQEWVKAKGLKVVVIFEGRDAAGKGGVIKRITQYLNPRVARVAALPAPTDRQKTEWYFQRYVNHLPAAGEIVLFDKSWYNRAGVEKVMGFCDGQEYDEFMRSCPMFERMLMRSGTILIKYWFSVSDEEQLKRFKARLDEPHKRWKLSPMDLESLTRWEDYSEAKDVMFAHTDTKQSPWYVVKSDVKRHAHLNCISHFLSMIEYEDLTPPPIELPERKGARGYVRPPMSEQTFVPDHHSSVIAEHEEMMGEKEGSTEEESEEEFEEEIEVMEEDSVTSTDEDSDASEGDSGAEESNEEELEGEESEDPQDEPDEPFQWDDEE